MPRQRNGTFSLAALALSVSMQCQAQTSPASQFDRGAQTYQQHCALCHGAEGRGGQVFARPIWGDGHDIAKFGSARGLFEYLQLLMPFDDPQKVSDDDKLAVTVFMLVRNGTLEKDKVLDRSNAAAAAIK